MKRTLAIGIGFAAALALPAFAAENSFVKADHHHVRKHIHRAAGPVGLAPNATAQASGPVEPQSWLQSWFSHIAPYPDDQGDTDGLSRNPSDCNKGCIDGP